MVDAVEASSVVLVGLLELVLETGQRLGKSFEVKDFE